MTTTEDVTVRGEAVTDLAAAVQGLAIGDPDDMGMVSISGDIGAAAVRALMRIEAELLLDDADALGGSPLMRTEGQRRADAFCQLADELGSALRLQQRQSIRK